jgi:type II secretory pathway pseudopilin PulG
MGRSIKTRGHKTRCSNSEAGFSLLEALISAVVLTVGLLAVCATLAMALSSTQYVQMDTIARQRATQALESIYTARQTATVTFDQIENVSSTGTGIFTSGFVALSDPGPDGIEGTTDDVPAVSASVPGPSGVLVGTTPPDITVDLSKFQRQIAITDVVVDGTTNPNLRQVQVTVKYPIPAGFYRSYTVQAMISSFR